MSLNGIDISSWQAGIDLKIVPCDFVIIKATGGTGYINPDCNRAFEQAVNTGKLVGVYHYARESGYAGDAITEADYFVNNCAGYIGKAVLVLDWEEEEALGVSWAKQWLDRVKERTGVKPLVYMSDSVVNGYNWSSVASADYGLWYAGYYASGTPMGYNPDAPLTGGTGAWAEVAMYQYTSEGQLSGWNGNLDLNVFYGDASAWKAYAKGSGGVNPPKPSPGGPDVSFTYAVQIGGKEVLPAVTNLADYAGIAGQPITGVAIKVNKGSVRYRVHLLGGGWLPWVTGYNWSDYNNGYAGNGQVIDAVQVYYETPADVIAAYGYQKAQYRVSPVNGGYYDWQYDDETGNGQDGYAGAFGVAMDRFQLF